MNEKISDIINSIKDAGDGLEALGSQLSSDASAEEIVAAKEQEKDLKKKLKASCRELIQAIDFRGLMQQQGSYIRQCMTETLDSYFLERNETRWGSWPINSANIGAYLDSYIWPRTGCLFMERARKLVFKKKRPRDYVKRLFKGGAPQELVEILGITKGLDHRYGLDLEQRMQAKINEEAGSAAEKAIKDVVKLYNRERIEELFFRNPLYGPMLQDRMLQRDQENRVKNGLLDNIPESYPELFPLARAMFRQFVLHIGPTNSGKSYDAMEALKTAGSGIYLAPLRLLAFEKFEELNMAECWCSLKTGEEEIQVPNSRVQSSTIEMLDFTKEYDIAVIDEAQMIADPQRGSAWTMALLGVQAKIVHVCLAPEAEKAVVNIIRSCGDSWEIVRHQRFVPLVYDNKSPIRFPYSARRGTAFIVFSRRDVHAAAAELQRRGYSCSVIYGALPYDVRRNEVRRYMNGETDIVVATDAIGMGLNLPIERIVFLRTSKFDGMQLRPLKNSEIKQIAGRAGRYGMFDKGYVSSADDEDLVRNALDARIPQIKYARIGFPYSLLGLEGSVSELMTKWCEIEAKPGFMVSDMDREIALAQELEEETEDKQLVYRFVMFPFDETDRDLKDIWLQLFRCENQQEERFFMEFLPKPPDEDDSLEYLERAFRVCDLLYHYADSFVGSGGTELYDISARKNQISAIIMEKLSNERLSLRRCRRCGRVLPFSSRSELCNQCRIFIQGNK